jgi:hypothetical protein
MAASSSGAAADTVPQSDMQANDNNHAFQLVRRFISRSP